MKKLRYYSKGLLAATGSALFLGIAPIFGKQSLLFGFTPLALVAIRTTLAAMLLLLFLLIFKRSFLYIYPLGAVGCLVAGFINGLGSILYYTSLSRIDASIGQLLYSFYPLFVAFWFVIDKQPVSRLTLLRLFLMVPGIYFLISNTRSTIDLVGAAMMIGSAVLYALHLLINQRVLFEVPAPTVTFYTLISMSITVSIAFLIFNPTLPSIGTPVWPLLSLALITFLSRISLFLGVKHLGGMQTALIGLGELLVTVVLAHIFLHERLEPIQWIGAFLIGLNMLLFAYDQPVQGQRTGKGFLFWLTPPGIPHLDYPFQN